MKSEAAVQSEIRERAGQLGVLLWRNNVGACMDETGRLIRYGLGNDSAQLQRRFKSSDLIGIYKSDCGCIDESFEQGVFLAVECKEEDWKFSPNDDRATAQLAFINVVRTGGGVAGFAASVADFEELLQAGKNRHP